ncbi:MAG: hypothetical protein WBC44_10290 [Planctomycetaceae bacterium]
METTERDGRTRVVSIGIARFADAERRTIPFAASDARAFAGGWESPHATRALTDADATTAAIVDSFEAIANAKPDDRIVVFVVSRATHADGDLLVQTHDGALSLRELLQPLWHGPAAGVVVLLDLQREMYAAHRISAGDLAALFLPSPSRTLVLADDGRNGSHVSGELQAGIWAMHVAAAFSGATPRARRPNGALTAGSLRAFLADEVTRSLARAYTDGRSQTPVVLAHTDDEVLAEPVAGDDTAPAPTSSLAGVSFFTERETPVKALGGFRKSLHSPPTDALATSRAWVARLAEADLAREVEETVSRLRRHLGYKRRDVRADGPQDGAASVLTPDFAYHVTVRQHDERPGQAVFRRTLDRIAKPHVLGRNGFEEAFPHGFQSLRFPFDAPVDLEALIDAVEESEPATVRGIEYPTDLSRLDLELAGFEGRVRIERDDMTITAVGPVSPAELASQFALVRRVLSS